MPELGKPLKFKDYVKDENAKVIPSSNYLVDLKNYLSKRIRKLFLFISFIFVFVYKFILLIQEFLVRQLFWGRTTFYRKLLQVVIGIITVLVGFLGVSNQISSITTIAEGQSSYKYIADQDILIENGSLNTIAGLTNLDNDSVSTITYTVKSGDSLELIARNIILQEKGEIGDESVIDKDVLNRKKSVIKWRNNLTGDNPILKEGQQLVIYYGFDGIIYNVKAGDTVDLLASKFKVNKADIVDLNVLDAPFTLNVGQDMLIPQVFIEETKPIITPKKILPKGNTIIRPQGNGVATGVFQRPLSSGCGKWMRGFSSSHLGVDLAQNGGCQELAADGGIVKTARYTTGGCGFTIEIDHQNGFKTVYCHGNGTQYVREGDKVSKGQPIQYMGMSGRATGIHLHFVVKYNNKEVDPTIYVPGLR